MEVTISSLFTFNSTVKNKQEIVDWFNSLTDEQQNFVFDLRMEAVNESRFDDED